MTSLQIDAVASPVEGATLAEDVHQPSNIKIRFKKGAVFAKSGDESAAVDVMAAQLLIKLSPGSETKRKAAEDMGENDEHVVSDISSWCKMWASGWKKNTLANPLPR
jgi:hypothetical protein